MIDTTLDVINKLGLHARASGKLIDLTSRYRSTIRIGRGDQLIDGKNIMQVLMLGAGQGTRLRLLVEGPDEQEAAKAIVQLFADRFHEGQ